MPSKYEEAVYNVLTDEPATPNEVAKRLGINYKTAKDALMHLAMTKKGVRYKGSSKIHLFWREEV